MPTTKNFFEASDLILKILQILLIPILIWVVTIETRLTKIDANLILIMDCFELTPKTKK